MKRKIIVFPLLLLIFLFLFSVISANETKGVRVLLYHHISAKVADSMIPTSMSLETFKEQMLWLKDNGYEAITISELFRRINDGTLNDKYVVITFDDGYTDVYYEVFPFMKDLGYPATTYIVGEKVDTSKNLTGKMLHDFYEAGWEIGSHSMSHSDMVAAEDLSYEVCYSRDFLADAAGIEKYEIRSFAYPYGSADEKVMTKVYKCGFDNGGGLGNMFVNSKVNPYYFARYSMLSSMNITEFSKLFSK